MPLTFDARSRLLFVGDSITDGVHPTFTGRMLIARTWLQATGSF